MAEITLFYNVFLHLYSYQSKGVCFFNLLMVSLVKGSCPGFTDVFFFLEFLEFLIRGGLV